MRALRPGRARLPLALALGALIVCLGSSAASFRSQAESAGNSIAAAPDFRAPAVTASAIAKAQGGETGWVRKGGGYFVYANVEDSGSPASGTASVAADLAGLTPGATAVELTEGAFSAGGQSYSHRSPQQTAGSTLAEGTVPYSLATVDKAGNAGEATGTVSVDNTPPAAADVQTANSSGGVGGKAEQGDTVTLTYSEPIEPDSILSAWDGSATEVVVRVTTGIALLGGLLGQSEGLQVFDPSNSAPLPLGAVDLERRYVARTVLLLSGTMTFGASGAPSTMSLAGGAVTIALGGHAGNDALTVATPGTMEWGPSSLPFDRAANPVGDSAATESGGADVEF